MDFQLSDEQALLRDTTRDLLSRTYDPESRNKIIGSDLGWSQEVWSQLADTGILGLGFDPDESGQIEITLVLNEVGRRLAPEPILHAALGPGALIVELGSQEQKQLLDEVAGGQRLLAFAHTEPKQRGLNNAVATKAVQQGDSWSLSGRKNPVLAGESANTLVVSAALPDGGIGLFLVDAEAVSRHAYPTFDGQRGAQIDLDSAPAEPLGDAVDASGAIRDAVVRIQSALCSEAVGAMEEALRLTTDYLKTRKQFGKPIGQYQAVQHQCADMLVWTESSRSATYYAAYALTEGTKDARAAVSVAKTYASDACREVGNRGVQVQGGMGFTWENDTHLFYRRAKASEIEFGDATFHRERIAKLVVDHAVEHKNAVPVGV